MAYTRWYLVGTGRVNRRPSRPTTCSWPSAWTQWSASQVRNLASSNRTSRPRPDPDGAGRVRAPGQRGALRPSQRIHPREGRRGVHSDGGTGWRGEAGSSDGLELLSLKRSSVAICCSITRAVLISSRASQRRSLARSRRCRARQRCSGRSRTGAGSRSWPAQADECLARCPRAEPIGVPTARHRRSPPRCPQQ